MTELVLGERLAGLDRYRFPLYTYGSETISLLLFVASVSSTLNHTLPIRCQRSRF